jgi:hypothetical protein
MCLTAGLTLPCDLSSSAGIQDGLYLMPCTWLDTAGTTISASGDIDAIAIDLVASGGATGFYKFDLKHDANGYTGELDGTSPNYFFTQTVTAVIPKMATATRAKLMEIITCNCGLIGIVVDNNCVQWVLGLSFKCGVVCRGLRVASGTTETTGIDPTADNNEYTVTLTSTVNELARELTAAIPLA